MKYFLIFSEERLGPVIVIKGEIVSIHNHEFIMFEIGLMFPNESDKFIFTVWKLPSVGVVAGVVPAVAAFVGVEETGEVVGIGEDVSQHTGEITHIRPFPQKLQV